MGCRPFRLKQYVDAKSTADFVGKGSKYGVFLVSVDIQDRSKSEIWSKEKNEWLNNSRQMILNFLGATVVTTLPPKSESLVFHARIPFSKEAFNAFQKSFAIEFDYNNFYSGFTGVIQTTHIQEAYLTPMKEETKIPFVADEILSVSVNYVLVGKDLLSDLKQLALEGIDEETQIKLIGTALKYAWTCLKYAKQLEIEALNEEHGDDIKSFLGTNSQEILIKGCMKRPYKEFYSYFMSALEEYENKGQIEEGGIKQENSLFFKNPPPPNKYTPFFPNNFEDLFEIDEKFFPKDSLEKAIRVYSQKGNKGIYHSARFFKRVAEMWKDDITYHYFHDPQQTKHLYKELMQTSWFNEIILKRCFKKEINAMDALLLFMNIYPETRDILLTMKDHLNFKAIEGCKMYFLLNNYMYSPGFKMIPLKLLKFYGVAVDLGSGLRLQNVLEGNFNYSFSSKPGESSNITVIAQEKEGRSFTVTHFYMKCCRYLVKSPVFTAVYFLPSEVPSLSSIEKFYGLTREKFEQGEYPQDDVLKPVGFVDITDPKAGNYGEYLLKEPLVGKILVCIFLSAKLKDQNMDISMTGCLGFLEGDFEKYKGVELEGAGRRVFSKL